ncbi:MAG: Trm112 family protein [Candidatus Aminicenantales bacterium]
MALDPELLKILACPLCKTEVKLTRDEKGLKCLRCHRVYRIEDDIPVMLIDEAAIEPERPTKD